MQYWSSRSNLIRNQSKQLNLSSRNNWITPCGYDLSNQITSTVTIIFFLLSVSFQSKQMDNDRTLKPVENNHRNGHDNPPFSVGNNQTVWKFVGESRICVPLKIIDRCSFLNKYFISNHLGCEGKLLDLGTNFYQQ